MQSAKIRTIFNSPQSINEVGSINYWVRAEHFQLLAFINAEVRNLRAQLNYQD